MRSSWLALATKSARMRASRSCSLRSRNEISSAGRPAPRPPRAADGRQQPPLDGHALGHSTTAGSDVASASSTAAISSGSRVTWLNGMPDVHLGKKSRNNPLKCKTDPSAASAIASVRHGVDRTPASHRVFGAPTVDGCSRRTRRQSGHARLLASAPGATAAAATATRPAISAAASFSPPKTKSRKRMRPPAVQRLAPRRETQPRLGRRPVRQVGRPCFHGAQNRRADPKDQGFASSLPCRAKFLPCGTVCTALRRSQAASSSRPLAFALVQPLQRTDCANVV